MNPGDGGTAPFFPMAANLSGMPFQKAGDQLSVTVNSSVTILIGPNGSGKTQVLRALRPQLHAKLSLRGHSLAVRYLAAGRAAPFEHFRSASNSNRVDTQPAAVGHRGLVAQRMDLESLTGDIMALNERIDLRIKVEARLYALFHRRVRLRWTQIGIEVSFQSAGAEYGANTEASGILHLVGLLAALYDDKIGALLIDEPEVSLHPQLQAFLLAEILRVAGNPLEVPQKKIVVFATHSPSMLPLREISELPNLIFFSAPSQAPRQLEREAGELRSRKLGALVTRLGEGHRSAFFAETVFLLEGPSDEIIVSMLSGCLGRELAGSGTQIVPVIGKGEIPETVRLFRLMGKRVVVLADLDALTDDNSVAMTFAYEDKVKRAAEAHGFPALVAIDGALRSDLARIVADCGSELEHLPQPGRRLEDDSTETVSEQATRRAVLRALLSNDEATLSSVPNSARWVALKSRFNVLLDILEAGGCFFLRRGTIEDYYEPPLEEPVANKPQAAVDEAAAFAVADKRMLGQRYDDVWRAIDFAAPPPAVDENSLLRGLLAALIGSVFQEMTIDTSDADLITIAASANEPAARIFRLENVSDKDAQLRALRISIISPLFARDRFPAIIRYDDNPHTAVARLFE